MVIQSTVGISVSIKAYIKNYTLFKGSCVHKLKWEINHVVVSRKDHPQGFELAQVQL
jgi:hypothetical protein